jgi:hypothetical protein
MPFCASLSTPGSSLFWHLRHVAYSQEIVKLEDFGDSVGELLGGSVRDTCG